jgi:hypothetical protein
MDCLASVAAACGNAAKRKAAWDGHLYQTLTEIIFEQLDILQIVLAK